MEAWRPDALSTMHASATQPTPAVPHPCPAEWTTAVGYGSQRQGPIHLPAAKLHFRSALAAQALLIPKLRARVGDRAIVAEAALHVPRGFRCFAAPYW